MINRVFYIGESVRIELIPAGDDENASEKSSLSADLLNLTGRLHLTLTVTDPITGERIAVRGSNLSNHKVAPSDDRTSAEAVSERAPNIVGVGQNRAHAEDDAVAIAPLEQLREEATFSSLSTIYDTHSMSTLQGEGAASPSGVTQNHFDQNDSLASTMNWMIPIQEEMASREDTCSTKYDILVHWHRRRNG